ncbi:hypothetical protein LR007_01450 [candidate division NPL-UPA2 bacterium]|nr:hypothetical protein [candidate division NPL-UPA2 bacterium]
MKKIRRFWKRNPKTRVKENAKLYSRPKEKKETTKTMGEELWRERKQKARKK